MHSAHILYVCSICHQQKSILYVLLEYGEMDLSVLLRKEGQALTKPPSPSIHDIWNQMLRAVQVNLEPTLKNH